MVRRLTTHRPLKKYSVGDLRHRITIHTRAIQPGSFEESDFNETYDAGVEHWAYVETLKRGVDLFDSVIMLPANETHKFVIRFDAEVTSENIVRWENRAYKILFVNNPEERNQYCELYCQLLGDQNLAVNT